jgi:fatty acid amide hydrolase 2
MWMESNNAVWGRSNNPYDATRIVGGSSGGEGSIIGSGASPFGIGADVGGSIRMPAFFNGVFGHKPTPGIIPNTGQYPHAEGEAGRYLCTGPLCRRAEDLTPLIRLAAGPDQVDPFTRPFSLPDPDLSLLRGMRVILITTNHLRRPSDPLVASMRRAADVLAAEGADVREVSLKSLRASFSLWSGLMSAASETSFASHMGGGPEVSPWVELARLFVGRSNHTLPAIILAIAEGLPGIDTADAAPLKQRAAEVRAELLEQMGPGGVILYPPYTRTAPRHREPLLTPLDFLYTALWNVLEFPVTQVPLGLDERGLPLGVQVVGAPYEDHRTITVALALEQALGGWVPPWVAASGSGRPRTVLQLAH